MKRNHIHNESLLPTGCTTEGSDANSSRLALPDVDTAGTLKAVFEQSPDCIKMLDPVGNLFFMNFNGVIAMEMESAAEHIGIPWWDVWPAETKEQVIGAVSEAQAGRSTRFTAFRPTAKGTPKWWDVGVSPVFGASAEVECLLVIMRDVTESVRRKEEIEVMSQEMRHRLKNAYAVSAAVSKLSASNRPELQDFAQELASRFSSLALAQSRILESNGSLSLNKLIEDLAGTFMANDGAKIVWHVPDLELHEGDIRILSMIFGELFTNALKYGPLAGSGTVSIAAITSQSTLQIDWVEKSPGSFQAVTPSNGGTGLVLISRLLRISGGTIEQIYESETLRYSISLPLRLRQGRSE
jgi:PAS domain S-box-containing protein